MTDKPIVLDEHRGMVGRTATEIRRASHAVEADQAALRRRQAELETFLVAAPAAGWPEAAEKARYLLKLFAATPDAQDPRRQRLIASVLEEFDRLLLAIAADAAGPAPEEAGASRAAVPESPPASKPPLPPGG